MAKARTKAAKRRAKAGRPRIKGVERTDAGRIRRNGANRDIHVMATVIDMRERLHGATDAKQPQWGYVLGRIWLDGNLGPKEGLGKARLEAGNAYAETVGRYYGLTGIPFPSARAQDLFAVGGYDGDVSTGRAEAARKIANRIMALEGVLLSCQDGRQVASTVKSVCVMDIEEARKWPEHMLSYLRRGLDALLLAGCGQIR